MGKDAGLWMSPRGWEKWIARYEHRGYRVLAPAIVEHSYGAAGVAIDSVPTEGIKVVPVSQIRATFPMLENPANRHRAVPLTPEQFNYAFINTLSEEESWKVYQRYHIPGPDGAWAA